MVVVVVFFHHIDHGEEKQSGEIEGEKVKQKDGKKTLGGKWELWRGSPMTIPFLAHNISVFKNPLRLLSVLGLSQYPYNKCFSPL